MPDIIKDRKIFSLLEVTRSIQKTLNDRYASTFWVQAEMSKLNLYHHSGHCYPELVEKKDDKVIAQMRANLWRDDYLRIDAVFRRVMKEPLKDGIKILFTARITFDSFYGLSLQIIDIDPNYSLGDLEREKRETIDRLEKEGIMDRNKSLPRPVLPQRIAVISVETSKGYADFTRVIDRNQWQYKFFYMLFPSLLQGDKAVSSIRNQLQRIKQLRHHFDVVAIIRGGGGDIGLSCYNNYDLVREIALFPLPVLTGIGHSTNETVAETAAFSNQITPTKVAEYLLQEFHNFSVPVQNAEEMIRHTASTLLHDTKNRFVDAVRLFRSVASGMLLRNDDHLRTQARSVHQQARFVLRGGGRRLATVLQHIAGGGRRRLLGERNRMDHVLEKAGSQVNRMLREHTNFLDSVERNVHNMSPARVLQRGFSITMHKGRPLTGVTGLKEGDTIRTVFNDGELTSTVNLVAPRDPERHG